MTNGFSQGKKVITVGQQCEGYKTLYRTFEDKFGRNEFDEVMNDEN